MDKDIEKLLAGDRFSGTRELIAALEALLTPREPEERKRVNWALNLMIRVHKDQVRHDGEPYYHHILRVTTRLIDDQPSAGVGMIIAALLHDSVEDEPGRILQILNEAETRNLALAAVSKDHNLGERVSRLIGHLTNPLPDPLDKRSKNQVYLEHVIHLFEEDPRAFVIKLADFGDNAFKLGSLENGKKKKKLQAKYGPVIRALIARLESLDNELHPLYARREELAESLRLLYKQQYQETDRPQCF